MPNKLVNVREPYASMTRKELVDEIDRYARNYNDLERSRDNYKREVIRLEELFDKLCVKIPECFEEIQKETLESRSGITPQQEVIFAARKLLRLLADHTPVFRRQKDEERLRKALLILEKQEKEKQNGG